MYMGIAILAIKITHLLLDNVTDVSLNKIIFISIQTFIIICLLGIGSILLLKPKK